MTYLLEGGEGTVYGAAVRATRNELRKGLPTLRNAVAKLSKDQG